MESRTKQQRGTIRTSLMKAEKRKSRGFYLRKRHNRWKWMVGASAVTAAGVTASQAGLITVNLTNNFISATGGNHLNADLTGDGNLDLTITGAFYRFVRYGGDTRTEQLFTASANLNGVHARAYFTGGNLGFQFGSAQLGSQHANGYAGTSNLPVLTGSIPITFTDIHINGGALTNGSLSVTVSTFDVDVQLDSFTYSSTSTIPDQGPSLGLLAMGAAGVLALRRWRAVHQQS